MNSDIVDILPAVNSLTGCSTTSRAGIEAATLKTTSACAYELLCVVSVQCYMFVCHLVISVQGVIIIELSSLGCIVPEILNF